MCNMHSDTTRHHGNTMSSGEREPIIPPPQSSTSDEGIMSYQEESQSSRSKMCQLLFVGLVVVLVLITIGLSIYRSFDATGHGIMYLLLGVNLITFGVLEIIMIIFVQRGHLPQGKTWFLYFVGGAVLLESVFTNIALFQ
ncbi:uncharacterized protein LOC143292970 [Babylonia areolata]|uniref:uncharacterized protein LOC143292970 n=1 Tax=Babylonia areolata TaxID=304850 RepID=UPI003FD25EA0